MDESNLTPTQKAIMSAYRSNETGAIDLCASALGIPRQHVIDGASAMRMAGYDIPKMKANRRRRSCAPGASTGGPNVIRMARVDAISRQGFRMSFHSQLESDALAEMELLGAERVSNRPAVGVEDQEHE